MRVGARLALGVVGLALATAGICVACVGDSSTPSTSTDGGVGGDAIANDIDGSKTPIDASTDGSVLTPCAQLPWPQSTGNVGPVQGVSTTFNEFNVTLTSDVFTLFLSRGSGNDIGVYESVRDASSSFPTDTRVTDILSTANGGMLPNVSADGLTMYLQYRNGVDGGAAPEGGVNNADAAADLTFNLYTYVRGSASSPWVGPTPIAGVNTAANEIQPFISADGDTLYFVSDRTTAGVFALYQASKMSPGVFGTVKPITGLAAAGASVNFPVMNAAGTRLFYGAPAGGAVTGEDDIWMVERGNSGGTFGAPVTVTQLSTLLDDRPGFISPDECRFYFTTRAGSTAGDFDVWLSRKR